MTRKGSRRNALLASAAAMAVVGLLTVVAWKRPTPATLADEATARSSPSTSDTAQNLGPASPLTIPLVPDFMTFEAALPDESTPLARSLPALRAAATRGNPIAACRIVTETMRCRASRARADLTNMPLRFTDSLLPNDPRQDPVVAEVLERRIGELPEFLQDAAASAVALRMDHSIVHAYAGTPEGDRIFCDGAIDVPNRELRHWLRAAALGGEPTSMRVYAAPGHWDALGGDLEGMRDGLAVIDAPEYRRWMVEAPQILDVAIARGDREALLAAVMASFGRSRLTPVLARDERRDAIRAVVALRVEGRQPAPSTADFGLSPAVAASADAEADALYRSAFAGNPDSNSLVASPGDADPSVRCGQ